MNTTLTPERIEELLPCPFCGGHADEVPAPGGTMVICRGCHVTSDDSNAVAKWNRRALSRDGMREALVPFAKAYETVTANKAVSSYSLAQIASLCACEISGVDYQRAYRALSPDAPRQKVEE